VTELDLDLKLLARRLAWSQGAATRLNVPLRAVVDRTRAGAAFQEFTDLDVLAVSHSPNSQVHLDIFDCKTSSARSTERMFWLAGIVDLFHPDQAWLVRERGITEAARVLAARLHLGTMSSDELEVMLRIHAGDASEHQAIRRLFDRTATVEYQNKLSNLDRRLRPLQESLRYDAWMVEPYQNLSMLPGALGTSDVLVSDNPVHVAIVLDVAWLYMYALSHGAAYVARTGAVDVEARFSEFYLGGQAGKRDKEAVRDIFVRVTGHRDAHLLPDYFPNLLEVFGRLFISPRRVTEGMRYLEVVAAGVNAKKRPNLADAFGAAFDPVTAKLTGDVLNLLIGAAGLPPSFRSLFRGLLLGPPPERSTATTAALAVESASTGADEAPIGDAANTLTKDHAVGSASIEATLDLDLPKDSREE